MLVLTRKCQEKIQIGDNITITIVRVKGQSVRVGIEAPRDLKVKRTELGPETGAPESGTVNTVPEAVSAKPAAVNNTPPAKQQPAAESPESESDGRSSFRPAKQPLKQFVPRNRLVSVTCAS